MGRGGGGGVILGSLLQAPPWLLQWTPMLGWGGGGGCGAPRWLWGAMGLTPPPSPVGRQSSSRVSALGSAWAEGGARGLGRAPPPPPQVWGHLRTPTRVAALHKRQPPLPPPHLGQDVPPTAFLGRGAEQHPIGWFWGGGGARAVPGVGYSLWGCHPWSPSPPLQGCHPPSPCPAVGCFSPSPPPPATPQYHPGYGDDLPSTRAKSCTHTHTPPPHLPSSVLGLAPPHPAPPPCPHTRHQPHWGEWGGAQRGHGVTSPSTRAAGSAAAPLPPGVSGARLPPAPAPTAPWPTAAAPRNWGTGRWAPRRPPPPGLG